MEELAPAYTYHMGDTGTGWAWQRSCKFNNIPDTGDPTGLELIRGGEKPYTERGLLPLAFADTGNRR